MNKPTDEQLAGLRVRIAELDGWRNVHLYEDDAGPSFLVGDPPKSHPLKLGRRDRKVPHFTSSLDAIIRAIRKQPDEGQHGHSVLLAQLVFENPNHGWQSWIDTRAIALAEPWQHCVALDRALSEEPIL